MCPLGRELDALPEAQEMLVEAAGEDTVSPRSSRRHDLVDLHGVVNVEDRRSGRC